MFQRAHDQGNDLNTKKSTNNNNKTIINEARPFSIDTFTQIEDMQINSKFAYERCLLTCINVNDCALIEVYRGRSHGHIITFKVNKKYII